MNTSIVGRGLELTDPIKKYAESAFEAIKKYNLDIISANIVLSENKKGIFNVEFIINVKDKHTVVITQKDKDLYAAIDLAVDRAQKSLRRYADKIKEHGEGIKSLELEESSTPAVDDEEDIIPMELKLYKPLDFEEAKELLRESEEDYLVFNDMDGNLRVLVKLENGKFGLY